MSHVTACSTSARVALLFYVLAPVLQPTSGVNRKLGLVVAAILIPGGLIALVGAFVLKRLAQTQRGQKVLRMARSTVPPWAKVPLLGSRQAA
jgi:hypothetical protein